MKLISWNVNGIRACLKKGFMEYFQAQDADIFCLQETKCKNGLLGRCQNVVKLSVLLLFWNLLIYGLQK